MSDVVQKLWGFCHTLRHDGIDYGDYIEQITYLLFLKMANERSIDLSRIALPAEDAAAVDCSWPALEGAQEDSLTKYYAGVLRALGRQPGLLGDIFKDAESRFSKAANLRRLIGLIDETEWTALEVDVKPAKRAPALSSSRPKRTPNGWSGRAVCRRPLISRLCARSSFSLRDQLRYVPVAFLPL